jgi:PAS domain S-box-containing protein
MVNQDINKKQIVAELDGIRQLVAELEQIVVEGDNGGGLPGNLFLDLPAAICVVKEGIYKFISPQLKQITGYSEHELIGASPLKLVLPEDRKMIGEYMVRLIKGRESLVHQFRIVTKNAQIKWVMEAASPITYDGGRAYIANLVDITENRKAEEAGHESEEMYHDLCENANDMIQCTAPDGRLVYVNQTWRDTLGYSEDEISNLSLFEIIQRDYVEHCLELCQRAISGENIGTVETVFVSKKGNRIPVEGNVNCRSVDGKPFYIRGIFRDVTERKRVQEEAEALLKSVTEINRRLEQSNRELEDFAYIASHDLQEPMRKISSFGELLRESLNDSLDEDQRENLEFMVDGARRMQLMIDDLLAYSRITTRAKPFQTVDPNEVVDELKKLELATALEETKGTILIPQTLLNVYGDPTQIHQLLQNLIRNGLKFHKDGIPPVVTIRSQPMKDKMVRFYVQDNGIGIEKEYHEQIFVMFKRLHSRSQYKGTGIGLAICKKIVQRHDGEVGVNSTFGEGSTFWFTLPRYDLSTDGSPGGD